MLARYVLWPYVCLSVCLSVTAGVLSKLLNGLNLFLAQGLPSAYPTLNYKGIRYMQK